MLQQTVTMENPVTALSEPRAPGLHGSNHAMPRSRSLCLNDIWGLARQKWEMAGRPDGDSSRFWQEAERELLQVIQ
jgi:hypothetical protein